VKLQLISKSSTPGDADVLLDGENIGPALIGITVAAGTHRQTRVSLDLAVFEFEVQDDTRLWVNQRTVELLARYGWRPPEGVEWPDSGCGMSLTAPSTEGEASPPVDHPV
jgi:hypothetical protein